MTKIEALEKALKLWEWLGENPGKEKEDAYRVLGLARDLYDCPACTFATSLQTFSGEEMCEHCPIWTEYSTGGFMCERPDSPYWRWGRGERQDAAGMVALVQERLREEQQPVPSPIGVSDYD